LQRIPAGGVRGDGRLTLSGDEKWFVSDPDTEQKVAPDGRFVLATVRLWEVGTGKEAHRLEITRTTAQMVGQYLDYFVSGKGSDEVVGTALSHDGKWVAAGTQRGEVHLWNGATGKKVRTFGRRSDNAAVPVGFSKDGKLLVTFNLAPTWTKYRQAVRVWDVGTGKEKLAIEGTALGPSDLGRRDLGPSVTDDGKWLLWTTGAEATTPRIWEVETGKEVRAFVGHKKTVTHGWVSRDKKLLATYDLGGSARLWDVATGKELRVLDVRPQPVGSWRSEDFQVRVSPDLKVLVAWSPSRLTQWDLENGKAIRSLRR
jgi:WD40 repeat protein